jgi:hypothetical protein
VNLQIRKSAKIRKMRRPIPIVLRIVLPLFLGLIPEGSNRRIQTFSLYSVNEQVENFTQNVADLDLVSSTVRENKLQSVCSQMGVYVN